MLPKDSKNSPENIVIGKSINLGLQLAVAVGLGFYLGWWLDKRLGTLPLFLLLGLGIGAVAGFLNIYRVAYPKKNQNSGRKKQGNEKSA